MVFQGLGQLRHNLVLYGHGVSSSTLPARMHPKLGMFLVVELCRTRWPRMSQTCSIGDKSEDRAPNRDDPHFSATGIAVLSSPNEVLRCHPAALRGVVEQNAEQPAVALH